MRAIFLVFGLISFATAAGACSSNRAEIEDDRFVYQSIERMRTDTSTEWTARVQRLAELRQAKTHSSEATRAQDACAVAYQSLTDAEEEIRKAEQSMKLAEAMKMIPPSVVQEVAAAEDHLARAKEKMPACDAAFADLAVYLRFGSAG